MYPYLCMQVTGAQDLGARPTTVHILVYRMMCTDMNIMIDLMSRHYFATQSYPICGGPLWTAHCLPDGYIYTHSLTR